MDLILGYFHQGLSAIVPFVVLLGVLIFIHELGHFLVARWCGVRVEVFSLGFGKKILKYQKGDTTYAVSIIPLGGYVKMFGDQPGAEISEEDKKHSFTHKNVWQRIAVVVAGPLMNFFFAILIFAVIAMTGEEGKKPVLGDIATGTAAYQAGFRSGDSLLQVNGNPVPSWEDFQRLLLSKEEKAIPLRVQIQREATGKVEEISLIAQPKPNPNLLSQYDYMAEVEGLSPFSKGTVIGVSEGTPLAALGMKTGDEITSVDGKSVRYWRDLEPLMANAKTDQPLVLELTGVREGDKEPKPLTVTYSPSAKAKSYSYDALKLENPELFLAHVMEKSPASEAGLKVGDRVLSINDSAVKEWDDILAKIKSYDGKDPVKVSVLREGKKLDLNIVPKMSVQPTIHGGEEKRYTIGISPVVSGADVDMVSLRTSNPLVALERGVNHTWDVSVMTVLSFVRLFENKISPKNIGGVISIGQAASETFKIGITQFLQMMAIISVNLFVLNLMPVPVLDGGHLLFYVIEVVKGAPVSLRKMEIAQQVGLAILMSLMVFALFNDFTRLLGL